MQFGLKLRLQNILLILFIASINFEVWDPLNTGGFFSIAKLTGFLYAGSLIPKLKHFTALPKKVTTFLKPALLFYLILVILNIFNIGYNTTSILETSILQNIILFWFMLNHERLKPGSIEKGFIGFLAGSILVALFYRFGIGITSEAGGRVSIFGDNQNVIGIRMAISSLFLTYLIFKENTGRKKMIYITMILAYAPLVSLLINTGSRIAFLSLFLGLIVFFTLYKTKSRILKPFMIVLGIGATLLVYNTAMQTDVLAERLISTAEEGNLAGRDVIWATIMPLIKNNWIIGVGRSGYNEYMITNFGAAASPHNVIIEILAYSGIIGLSIFLFFLFRVSKTSFVYFRQYRKIAPMILLLPIFGLMLSGQILYTKIAWVIFAYAASRIFYIDNKKLVK